MSEHSVHVRHLVAVPEPTHPNPGIRVVCSGCRGDGPMSLFDVNAHGCFLFRCDGCGHEFLLPRGSS